MNRKRDSVLFCIIVFKICACATFGQCQLLDILEDNIYEASPVQECVHEEQIPSIDFDDDYAFSTCHANVAESKKRRHPDQDKRTDQVILKYGHNLITYNNVTTDDGYMLTVFRIPGNPLMSPPANGKPAVLLFHGAGTASDEWVLQADPKKNLPFMLANAGYDVWLANARGTDFSQGHVKLNVQDLKYWDFSFHEVGLYDFPAILDLILAETGNEKIFYIGHSLGGAAYAAALAEIPELNQRIHASFLLAPSIFVGHAYHPTGLLSGRVEFGPRVQNLLNSMLGGHIEGSIPQLQQIFESSFCTPTAMKCGVCENVLFYLYGYDAPQINTTNLPNILSKSSNTQSVKTFIHWGQNFRSCEFRKYDYGLKSNLRRYGQTQPPMYNLTNLQAPLYIYYGDADNFVPPVDAAILRDSLPPGTVKAFKRVQWKYFNHIDFAIAKDADVLLYNNIIKNMNKYTYDRFTNS